MRLMMTSLLLLQKLLKTVPSSNPSTSHGMLTDILFIFISVLYRHNIAETTSDSYPALALSLDRPIPTISFQSRVGILTAPKERVPQSLMQHNRSILG